MTFRKSALLLSLPLALLAGMQSSVIASASGKERQAAAGSIRWTGTATAVLQYGDLTIVTDPAFDASGGTYDIGFAVLEKTEDAHLGSQPLPKADIVLLSHDQHADNLDTSGRAYLSSAGLTLTTPEAARRLGGRSRGLKTWETYRVGEVTITAVPAQHGPAPLVPAVGPVTGFIISSQNGPTIYFSGDTIAYEGTEEIARRYRGEIDYALLNAGGVNAARPEDPPIYATMRVTDALKLADDLAADRFSIMHADSWKHFSQQMPETRQAVLDSDIAYRFVDLTNHQVHPIPFGR